MIQVPDSTIIVAAITTIGLIVVAIIGASKYGKRKAETNLFAELRNSTSALLDSSRETITDLRATIVYVRAERDKAIEERDRAIEELDLFKKDFHRMKDIVQANTVEIAIIREASCIKSKVCKDRKTV